MLLVKDDLIEEEITRLGGGNERQTEEVEEIAKLFINSVVGLSAPKTMKIKGKKDQQEVITMMTTTLPIILFLLRWFRSWVCCLKKLQVMAF